MDRKTAKDVNVLVIDDEERVCELLHKMLEKIGYHVETFTESSRALTRFDEQSFDVVTTDLIMPGLTGFDVAKYKKEKKPAVPVILITGEYMQYYKKYLTKSGIDFFIPKPFKFEEIKSILEKAMQLKKEGQ